jgi:amino acid transporter
MTGSRYTYSYATIGEFIAWIIGWDLILEYALGATTVAIGWSRYVVRFLKDFQASWLELCRARCCRGVFFAISGSTRHPPPHRRPRARNATCRPSFSARWPFGGVRSYRDRSL